MNFELTEEQLSIKQMAHRFAIEKMLPNAAKWDKESIFPKETLRLAAALGFAGIYCS